MRRMSKIIPIIILVFTAAGQPGAETDLTALVKKVRPAVVTIVVYDINKRLENIGTGFFVDKKGHVVTNHHVLAGKYSADVRTSDGNTYPVKFIVAENKSTDLVKVLVDIPEKKVRWLEVEAELPPIAQRVVVVGSPMGLEQTVSEGIVSSVREIPGIGNFFQISAPISPGSSGSPVINTHGKVIGVATFQFAQGQNLNFAISAKSVLDLKVDGPGLTISEWTYNLSRQKPRLAAEMCQKGFSFSINGENHKALEYFKKATERDPNDPLAWYGLGYCQAGLNNQEDAIEAYKQAIRVNPYDENTYFNLANYYNKIGRNEEAVEAYEEVIRLNPDFEAAYFNLGIAYARLGKFAEGKKAFEAVIRLNPTSASAYYNAGVASSQLGQYQDAIEAQKQVIRLQPDFAAAHYSLGMVYGKMGKLDEEINEYKEAIRIDPNFAPAHFNIGYAFLQQGNKAAALDEYQILRELDQDTANKLFDIIYR